MAAAQSPAVTANARLHDWAVSVSIEHPAPGIVRDPDEFIGGLQACIGQANAHNSVRPGQLVRKNQSRTLDLARVVRENSALVDERSLLREEKDLEDGVQQDGSDTQGNPHKTSSALVGYCKTCHAMLKIWEDSQALPLGSVDGKPLGIRSPNGQVWAASIHDLYIMPHGVLPSGPGEARDMTAGPGLKILRMQGLHFLDPLRSTAEIWSKSMIAALKDAKHAFRDDSIEDSRNHKSRIEKPFPFVCHLGKIRDANHRGSLTHGHQQEDSTSNVSTLEAVVFPPGLQFLLLRHAGHIGPVVNLAPAVKLIPEKTTACSHDQYDSEAEPYIRNGYLAPCKQSTIKVDRDCTPFADGNHSRVFRASLQCPGRDVMRVVMKVSKEDHESLGMLKHEASTLHHLSSEHSHLRHEWSGLNAMPGRMMPTRLHAVIPRFFGYYQACTIDPWSVTYTLGKSPPFILLEDCGHQIEPGFLEPHTRHDVLAMFTHLHNAGYVHGSPHRRNIMIQPGPLSHPPEERSIKNPSLRLIDFGRTCAVSPRGRERTEEYKEIMKTMRVC